MTPIEDNREMQEILRDLGGEDARLRDEAAQIAWNRAHLGLEGLVGGLQAVMINTEPERQRAASEELLRCTGLQHSCSFKDSDFITCVLKAPVKEASLFRSADILIRSRLGDSNPFRDINSGPKSGHLPNTRLETFLFETKDIDEYFQIQKSAGFRFLTGDILDFGSYRFIQTEPSRFTGNSLGFIQWTGKRGDYATKDSRPVNWDLKKPHSPHLRDIKWLDHAATSVKAQDRDPAILEFMKLTNYNFDFAIYVEGYNSITSVARLSSSDFAMVFTSGISPYVSDGVSGPTEKFIHNYGPRVHHIAFQTEQIENTYQGLLDDGQKFLLPLVGSPEEGLKQTFSEPSSNTLLVNEYIHRYGNFNGFFTKSNVTLLTAATGKQ